MTLFKKKIISSSAGLGSVNNSDLAEIALNVIGDGVMVVDANGVIQYCNPAGAILVGYNNTANLLGLNYRSVLHLETIAGEKEVPENNPLSQALATNSSLSTRDFLLVSAQGDHKTAISLKVLPTGGAGANRLITFRDITKELKESQEQSEFISTASHEMRTPVASIEGYLGLALNPQTAAIDDRARQYLTAAHAASQHLGHLFKDLLDVTQSEDGRLKPRLVPVDLVELTRTLATAHAMQMQAKHISYSFGTETVVNGGKHMEPKVFAAVDLEFMHEVLDNLIENAIKYTPEGGEIWINARGDGDQALINVTDTGIGISPEDAAHIFQKFYRVDNSHTRSIGGTGLGLYLVKQRIEAMGGRVWVESSFGDGSTFFVSLPRLNEAEYQQQLMVYQSEQAKQQFAPTGQTAPPAQVPTPQPPNPAQTPAPQPPNPAQTQFINQQKEQP